MRMTRTVFAVALMAIPVLSACKKKEAPPPPAAEAPAASGVPTASATERRTLPATACPHPPRSRRQGTQKDPPRPWSAGACAIAARAAASASAFCPRPACPRARPNAVGQAPGCLSALSR